MCCFRYSKAFRFVPQICLGGGNLDSETFNPAVLIQFIDYDSVFEFLCFVYFFPN